MKIIKPTTALPDYKSKYFEAVAVIKNIQDILYFGKDIEIARYLLADWINLHNDFLAEIENKNKTP